jgi:hypothetical protein
MFTQTYKTDLEEIDKLEGNIQNGTKEVIVQVPSGKFRITITNCSKLKMGFSKQPFAATVTSTGTHYTIRSQF